MGKMTKHKCDWKPTQLEAAIAAKELHAHTATILGNPNQFKPRYDLDRMTLREAVRTVMEVYKCCYKANEINAKDNPMLARRRLALQVEAIVSVKWLQALQDVIRGQFHVDSNKFWNWAEMTENTLKKIKACQKGKGTDAARKYYATMLHRAWLRYRTADFRIVVVDVKGYYDNMDHRATNAMFAEMCDPWTASQVTRTLDKQYKGDKGYNPGSQMVQIAGISYLDRLDHYMKEVLRRKLYIRYMDDIHIVAKDEADAAYVMEEVSAQLKKVGLSAHPVKSRIVDAREGAVFLGFLHRVADNGKVLVSCDTAKVKANRRKMRRIVNKIIRRRVHKTALAESWQSMYNHLAKGNSKRLERRMTEFYNSLEKEIEGATT